MTLANTSGTPLSTVQRTMEGDAKATNAAHDRLQEVFKSIVNKGQGESPY